MKKLPIAFKLLLNILFFVIYSIIFMNIINFLYDLYLYYVWKVIPLSDDIVHLKIAWIVFIFTLIFTLIFRKYFYISLVNKKLSIVEKKKEIKEKKIDTVKTEDNLEIFVWRK